MMKSRKWDAFLVPRCDMFSGEEVPENEERLKFITNFSGSAGYAIISAKSELKSAIFSDGRYQLQLKKEVNSKCFNTFNGGFKEVCLFLSNNKNILKKVVIDPWLLTLSEYKFLQNIMKDTNTSFEFINKNIIDEVWLNKPLKIDNKIFKLPIKYTGETVNSKINRLKKVIENNNCDFYILFNPTGLSWLLNIRGRDLKHTPISRSFCIVSKQKEIHVFTNNNNFQKIFKKYKDIQFSNYEYLSTFLEKYKNKNFMIESKVLPMGIFNYLEKNELKFKYISCPVDQFKTIKNPCELKGFKNAHLKDGLAILKLLFWFEKKVYFKNLTEMKVSQKLLEIRSLEKTFVCESFSTISAFGSNGAIIHYKVDNSSNKTIDRDGLYLIDTGAHYLDGTTDTTRTLLVGKADTEMIENYTLVLKGHIAIASAVFPNVTKGRDIDALARLALWSKGKDYAHGTGHGVGSVLSVHEGPISISKTSECVIENGMVISNEPGYYRNGKYGIRIENLEIVSKHNLKKSKNFFLHFENLTRVPLELKLINKKMLTKFEIDWVNEYHQKVFKDLSKFIETDHEELLIFLQRKTAPI